MPLEHAAASTRKRAAGLLASLGDMVRYAKLHRNIIQRLGCFPHRNVVLVDESRYSPGCASSPGGFAG